MSWRSRWFGGKSPTGDWFREGGVYRPGKRRRDTLPISKTNSCVTGDRRIDGILRSLLWRKLRNRHLRSGIGEFCASNAVFVVDSLPLSLNDTASSSPHSGPKTEIKENLKQERNQRVMYAKGFVYFSETKTCVCHPKMLEHFFETLGFGGNAGRLCVKSWECLETEAFALHITETHSRFNE